MLRRRQRNGAPGTGPHQERGYDAGALHNHMEQQKQMEVALSWIAQAGAKGAAVYRIGQEGINGAVMICEGQVVTATPLLRFTIGWSPEALSKFCGDRGWALEIYDLSPPIQVHTARRPNKGAKGRPGNQPGIVDDLNGHQYSKDVYRDRPEASLKWPSLGDGGHVPGPDEVEDDEASEGPKGG
jgi:hypothetical protein